MHHADILRNVHAGMRVLDSAGRVIGKVEWVKYGDDDPSTPEPEASGISPIEDAEPDSLLDTIADAFRTDGLPAEIRERLLHQGFVRIDADGLFSADRYITPEQIAQVSAETLMLKVSEAELLKRP
jgi:hypothetical protein